jgi:predicted metal-dependent hydrolase
MANKDFTLEGGIAVTIYKRKSSRNLRLSIAPTGQVKVSIPTWAPYSMGLDFAAARKDWILGQQKAPNLLTHGQAVGKAHHLEFKPHPAAAKASGRVNGSLIAVTYPNHLSADSREVQTAATEASVRALRVQAEQLLPQRLAALARLHDFEYRTVGVKRLKSRWGSCDQQKNIVLNLFLMQLPWELIDYVLLHELTHTVVLRHGADFWEAMTAILPDVKAVRKRLRQHQPVLNNIV